MPLGLTNLELETAAVLMCCRKMLRRVHALLRRAAQ